MDCFSSAEESCETSASQVLRYTQHFVKEAVERVFDRVQYGFDTARITPGYTACSKLPMTYGSNFTEYGGDFDTGLTAEQDKVLYESLPYLVQGMNPFGPNGQTISLDLLKEMASNMWLMSVDTRIKTIAKVKSDHLSGATVIPEPQGFNDCFEHFKRVDPYYIKLLQRWVFAQGGERSHQPPVPLGEVVGPDGFLILAKVANDTGTILNKIFDEVELEKDLPMYLVSQYVGFVHQDSVFPEGPDKSLQKWKCSSPGQIKYFQSTSSKELFCNLETSSSTSGFNMEGCCELEKALNNNYKHVLRQMKYALNPTTWHIEESSEVRDLSLSLKGAGFSAYSMSSITQNYQPTIFGSTYGTGHFEKKPVFYRTPSTSGIAVTFNAKDFLSTYQSGPYIDAFYEEFVNKSVDSAQDAENSHARIFPQGYGPLFSFQALVYINDDDGGGGGTGFMTLQGPDDLPDLRNNPISIVPGNSYDIVVTPSLYTSDQSVLDMDPDRRSCLTREESQGLTLFKEYSYGACKFECQLKKASSACGCVPWNYPQVQDAPLCHMGGSQCFEESLSEGLPPEECDCPEECSSVRVRFCDYASRKVFFCFYY